MPQNLDFQGENGGSKLIPNRFLEPGIHVGTPPIWLNVRGHLNLGGGTPSRSSSAKHYERCGGSLGGSKPEWADVNDHATLEEVFKSRSFGRPIHESRAAPRPPGAIPAPGCFSVATASSRQALSRQPRCPIVAGLSIGAGPMAQSVLSAHAGSPAAPDLGTTPTTTVPSSAGASAGTAGTGNQPSGAAQVSGGNVPASIGDRPCGRESGTAERRLHADRDPDRDRDGPLRPGRGRNGRVDHDDDNDHDDDHHPHHTDDHHDDHDQPFRFRQRPVVPPPSEAGAAARVEVARAPAVEPAPAVGSARAAVEAVQATAAGTTPVAGTAAAPRGPAIPATGAATGQHGHRQHRE